MTLEAWIWIAIAVAVVVVAAWPLLRRRGPAAARWTADAARSRIAELEAALNLPDLDPAAREKAERHLLLAGAALAGTGRHGPDRAGRWAESGLAALGRG